MLARRSILRPGPGLATLATAAVLVACADIRGTIPARELLPTGGCPGFEAGAARIDLTPPPGYPLGGFSIAGKMARGRWTPLQARAIYMQDKSCRAVVLVSTDLMILPNGLADRVADRLGKKDATKHIGRENMLITATENHLSPGNYFSSKLYNAYSSRVAGFDAELFDYLSEQLAQVVTDAVADQRAAVLRTAQGPLKEFFRNRSLPAFLRNREALEFLSQAESSGASRCEPLPYAAHPLASPERFHELACLAVVPRVDVIEVVEAGGDEKRIALAGFLATHTTVLPAAVEAYSADLLGITALRMERGELPASCAADGEFPVVALFNGAQGDISSQWSTRGRGDLLDRSDRITERLCSLVPGSEETSPTLAFQYDEVEPLEKVAFDDPFDGQKYTHKTPSVPDAGAPEIGGASDGRTLFYELAHREELTSFRRTEHGSKIPPFTLDIGLLRIALGRREFNATPPPKAAPLTLIQVGETVLVGVPGEMTTMMGARTRNLIAKQHGFDASRLVIVGFGNGHVSYFPTTEEYDAQWYEGASDYYGPGTGSYLATRLSKLAGKLKSAGSIAPKERPYDYWVGPKAQFRARDVGHPAYHPDDGLVQLVSQLELVRTSSAAPPTNPIVAGTDEPRIPKRDYPTYCFMDALPLLEDVREEPDDGCRRTFPVVSIHEAGDSAVVEIDGRQQDSDGTEIITLLSTAGEDRAEWCAVWMAPHALDPTGMPTNRDTMYEFHVQGITQKEGESLSPSPPFTLNDGFDTSHPLSLVCEESADDASMVGGIFTERASCEPLERPVCSNWFSAFCDIGIRYCEAPEPGS